MIVGVVEFINASGISVEWHQVLNLIAANDEAWCYMLSVNLFCVHINLSHVSWLTEMVRCISAPLNYIMSATATYLVIVSSSVQNCMSVRLKTPLSGFLDGPDNNWRLWAAAFSVMFFHAVPDVLYPTLSHINRRLIFIHCKEQQFPGQRSGNSLSAAPQINHSNRKVDG